MQSCKWRDLGGRSIHLRRQSVLVIGGASIAAEQATLEGERATPQNEQITPEGEQATCPAFHTSISDEKVNEARLTEKLVVKWKALNGFVDIVLLPLLNSLLWLLDLSGTVSAVMRDQDSKQLCASIAIH